MRDDVVLSVGQVDTHSTGAAVVGVRSLGGTLRVGHLVRVADAEGRFTPDSALLTVRAIWRYGKTVDVLDRAYTAKVELTGEVGPIAVGDLILGAS